MQTKDIAPGGYYRVRLERFGGEQRYAVVRVDKIAPPRYPGDQRTVVAWHDDHESRHAPRDIIAPANPVPVKTDFRFAARVDYFTSRGEALAFAAARRAQGHNVSGNLDQPLMGSYAGLYGVHWYDREGEGWYA